MHIRRYLLFGLLLCAAGGLLASPALSRLGQVAAAPVIFASPVHGGCYIAAVSDCRLHVEPFTINLATGTKLANFRLVAIRAGAGTETIIYDFRPDQSNPAPPSGNTYTPTLVAQDFAATCGQTYSISLQGQDTGDANAFNLGLTGQFTCPAAVP